MCMQCSIHDSTCMWYHFGCRSSITDWSHRHSSSLNIFIWTWPCMHERMTQQCIYSYNITHIINIVTLYIYIFIVYFFNVRLFSHISQKSSYMFTYILINPTSYSDVNHHGSSNITTSFHQNQVFNIMCKSSTCIFNLYIIFTSLDITTSWLHTHLFTLKTSLNSILILRMFHGSLKKLW